MGMDNFNITLLYDNVTVVRERGFWKLEGFSNYMLKEVHDYLIMMCDTNKNGHHIYDECIDVRIHESRGWFQGFELVGCLSFLKGGVKDCWDFYEVWNRRVPLKIYVLNQEIEVKNSEELYEVVSEKYKEKIEIFKKSYGDIEVKATGSEFRKIINKQNNWLYRLLHH